MVLISVACSSPAEKRARHLEKAQKYFSEGKYKVNCL